MKVIFVFTLFLVLMGAMLASPVRDYCMCPPVYAPVCGVNGVTYGNSCVAGCDDVEVAYKGYCRVFTLFLVLMGAMLSIPVPDYCMCPPEYDPVCGVNGVSYLSDCFAICDDVEVAYKGYCGGDHTLPVPLPFS